jgi:hypothetical protein
MSIFALGGMLFVSADAPIGLCFSASHTCCPWNNVCHLPPIRDGETDDSMTLLLDETVLEICWSSVLACAHSAKPAAQLVGALQGRILVSI